MGVVPFRSEAVVETIAVYLVEDRSMPRVACDPVHVNTLRYRFKGAHRVIAGVDRDHHGDELRARRHRS